MTKFPLRARIGDRVLSVGEIAVPARDPDGKFNEQLRLRIEQARGPLRVTIRTGDAPPRTVTLTRRMAHGDALYARTGLTPVSLTPPMDMATFETKAGAVADMLKAIGNARRLMLLCQLVEYGELTVGDLARDVGLSQSACSQHLARMRDEGLVAFRRESQTLWYRIADPRVETLLATLYQLYCKD